MGQIKKLHKIKCFLIISVNLDPKCQVPKPKSAFYQNTLILNSVYFFYICQLYAGEDNIRRIVTGAMVDCRREFLWQKLLDSSPCQHALTHVEFMELISLVHHETLDNVRLIKYHLKQEQIKYI